MHGRIVMARVMAILNGRLHHKVGEGRVWCQQATRVGPPLSCVTPPPRTSYCRVYQPLECSLEEWVRTMK
jgi:hypothetical protein